MWDCLSVCFCAKGAEADGLWQLAIDTYTLTCSYTDELSEAKAQWTLLIVKSHVVIFFLRSLVVKKSRCSKLQKRTL